MLRPHLYWLLKQNIRLGRIKCTYLRDNFRTTTNGVCLACQTLIESRGCLGIVSQKDISQCIKCSSCQSHKLLGTCAYDSYEFCSQIMFIIIHAYSGYRVFPGGKVAERGADHPPPSKRRGHERVELYLYSPSGPSWPVIGRTFTFTYYSCVRKSSVLLQNVTYRRYFFFTV